ncbi:BASIC LEUCINE ZIPPER 4 [Salix purpurea]|uniref:BASIC LEUCINE ZIPPER 4 n=1 Tax=Salix purpurea TaxID=77065 RepID=A0A9Q0SJ59_SALPP|nr:BASIC LEUCINE ZIPPER 4 [Salix purpurea]
MLSAREAIQLEHPGHGPGFTANEIQELLSLLQYPSPCGNSGSRGSNQAVNPTDERKRKRKESNRESARRSRWRRKKHLEGLTQQLNRLKIENRELQKRLGSIINQSHALWRENDYLMSESMALKARLSGLRHLLVAMNAMQQAQ